MRLRTALITFAVASAALATLAVVPSGAQTDDDDNLPTWQHAAKFICGDSGGTSDASQPVLVGTYATEINVHNPNLHTVRGNATTRGGPSTSASFSPTFRKKVLVLEQTTDGGVLEAPQPPSAWFRPDQLRPDWGMMIDCLDIRSHLLAGDPHADDRLLIGFVVIEARGKLPLDVVATYTVMEEEGVTFTTTSVDVETVQPKRIRSG